MEKGEPIDIQDAKGLIYVPDAWLDKNQEKLATPSASSNVAQNSGEPGAGKSGYNFGTIIHIEAEIEKMEEDVMEGKVIFLVIYQLVSSTTNMTTQ